MRQAPVAASVMDTGEQGLLFVVEFGEQISVNRREEGVFEQSVFPAIGLHPRHIRLHCAGQLRFRGGCSVEVRQQGRVTVAAVKVLGIPLFIFFKGRGGPSFRLFFRHLHLRQSLGLQRLAIVGPLDIRKQYLARGAVTDDVMNILQKVKMFLVFQQTNPKEPVFQQRERLDESGFDGFDVVNLLHFQRKAFLAVDALHGLVVAPDCDTGEQGGMDGHGRLDGAAQPIPVQVPVQGVAIGNVITGFSFVGNTLHIKPVLCFCQWRRHCHR